MYYSTNTNFTYYDFFQVPKIVLSGDPLYWFIITDLDTLELESIGKQCQCILGIMNIFGFCVKKISLHIPHLDSLCAWTPDKTNNLLLFELIRPTYPAYLLTFSLKTLRTLQKKKEGEWWAINM